MSALGFERPVSTKLRWRAETPASSARSSWLRRRRWRQARSIGPIPLVDMRADSTVVTVVRRGVRRAYLAGNRLRAAAARS